MAPDASSRGRGEVLQDFWRGRHARRQRAFVGPRVLDEVFYQRPRATSVHLNIITEETGRGAAREERREGDEGPIFHILSRASAALTPSNKNGLLLSDLKRLAQAARLDLRASHVPVDTVARQPVPSLICGPRKLGGKRTSNKLV